MKNPETVTVIGGGLAGVEAAWQVAGAGVCVHLFEMRPSSMTGAHKTGGLAELVCSNSFKSRLPNSASGELKREMRLINSLILECAEESAIPAGEALAVDRDRFSASVEQRLKENPLIEIIRSEVPRIPDTGVVIVASGPLTSDSLASDIGRVTGRDRLHFYDAVAPIVETDSIDFNHCWEASRYGRGEAAYLNCPLTEQEYDDVWNSILNAETVPLREFEDAKFFEGCLPVEEIARRGRQTLAHGPWKPVGLIDPHTGKRPYAVLQLRRENAEGTCYSLVACQSRMTWPEQRRIFAKIPALKNAVWLRLGVVHRNTYLDSPRLLNPDLSLRTRPSLFFAGQIVGVEGYLESAATGIVAGLNAARMAKGVPCLPPPPPETMLGALLRYVSACESPDFAPMNSNFGILPALEDRNMKKDLRRRTACDRALAFMQNWCSQNRI